MHTLTKDAIRSEMEQLVKIMENPKEMEILKEVANNQNMLRYISYFEKYKQIAELASNVNNTIEQQVVRKKVKDIAKEFLYDTAPNKVLLSPEMMEGLAVNVQSCGLETLGNKIDISFLKPITREVLTMLVVNTLPVYRKALEQKQTESSKGSNPTLAPSKSFSNRGSLGGLGSLLSLHNLPSLPALPAAPSPKQQRSGSVITIGASENLEHLIAVLNSPTEVELLKKILEKQHCMENLHYYERQNLVKERALPAASHLETFRLLTAKSLLSITDKKSAQTHQIIKDMIIAIANDFIFEGSPQELNISAKVRYEFEEKLKKDKISLAMLEPVTKEVLNSLLRNSFSVYKKLKARDKNATQSAPEVDRD